RPGNKSGPDSHLARHVQLSLADTPSADYSRSFDTGVMTLGPRDNSTGPADSCVITRASTHKAEDVREVADTATRRSRCARRASVRRQAVLPPHDRSGPCTRLNGSRCVVYQFA